MQISAILPLISRKVEKGYEKQEKTYPSPLFSLDKQQKKFYNKENTSHLSIEALYSATFFAKILLEM